MEELKSVLLHSRQAQTAQEENTVPEEDLLLIRLVITTSTFPGAQG